MCGLKRWRACEPGMHCRPPSRRRSHDLLHPTEHPGGQFGDIRDGEALATIARKSDRRSSCTWRRSRWSAKSYAEPAETFDVNVMGTVRLLEAARATPSVKAVLVVTTDKVYRNGRERAAFPGERYACGMTLFGAPGSLRLAVATWRRPTLRSAAFVSPRTRRNVIGGGRFLRRPVVPTSLRAALSGSRLNIAARSHAFPGSTFLIVSTAIFSLPSTLRGRERCRLR